MTSTSKSCVFALLLSSGIGLQAVPADAACTLSALTDATKYQEVFQPTCHNCYEKGVAEKMGAKTFKQVLDQVLNVEIDFWDTRDAVSGGKPHEWFVRHNPGSLFQSGNDNNCSGDGNGTNNLSACLGDVRSWSLAHPGHLPITLFLDKKQAWSPASQGRTPADLDQLLRDKLGDRLYAPALLQGGSASLRDAAKSGAWPVYRNFKDKVIVVLTGGQTGQHNQTLNAYVEKRTSNAAAFVAADTDETGDITGTPTGFNSQYAPYVVFYNIEAVSNRAKLGTTTRQRNYVSRLWGGDKDSACGILAECINDNALKEWNKGSCNGLSSGVLTPPAQ